MKTFKQWAAEQQEVTEEGKKKHHLKLALNIEGEPVEVESGGGKKGGKKKSKLHLTLNTGGEPTTV